MSGKFSITNIILKNIKKQYLLSNVIGKLSLKNKILVVELKFPDQNPLDLKDSILNILPSYLDTSIEYNSIKIVCHENKD